MYEETISVPQDRNPSNPLDISDHGPVMPVMRYLQSTGWKTFNLRDVENRMDALMRWDLEFDSERPNDLLGGKRTGKQVFWAGFWKGNLLMKAIQVTEVDIWVLVSSSYLQVICFGLRFFGEQSEYDPIFV